MPSRVPLTNLTDRNKGGAPLYVGGDRHPGEPVATPPNFVDDEDPYLLEATRRGLLTIAHIPPAGANTVDFVYLYLRNNSTTDRKYVNVFMAADISAQLRVSSLQTAYPRFADVMVVEDDAGAILSASLNENNEIEITVVQNGRFTPGLVPSIQFDPPLFDELSAHIVLTYAGEIDAVTVLNPGSHSYTSPPSVTVRGGVYRELGFYQQADEGTLVYGSSVSGYLFVFGDLCRTEFANNISSAGDVLIANNELRVVRSINREMRELTLDRPLSASNASFDQWAYIPLLSASESSLLRVGHGTISNDVIHGFVGVICSSPHNLCVGDYIIYQLSGVYYSHRVQYIESAYSFSTETNVALSHTSSAQWYYVYYLSETDPGATALNAVQMITYTKTQYETGRSVNVLGIGGRDIFLRNLNYMNEPGSYYNPSFSDTANVVLFSTVSDKHNDRPETVNTIQPHHTLAIVLKPQPAPEVQVLAGFPVNGGLATEVGKRPMIALNERACNGVSSDVVFWGYYVRYEPDSATNYTQAINV